MAARPLIRDPSGILARVPELEEIAVEDPRILVEVELGRPHAIYRALRWGLLTRRIRKNAAVAKELLANRRLFLQPARGRVWLTTFNGVGAGFIGESEPDFVDGTSIATHFVLLLLVPIFPLGQYLVRDNSGAGGGQSYAVFGKVPLSTVYHLWSRILTLLVFAGFLAMLLSLFRSTQHNVLTVVNEIGAPVEVTVAGHTLHVDSGARASADLPTGDHEISVHNAAHRLLEQGRVQIRPGPKVNLWNVLGAALIVRSTIEYRTTPSPDPSKLTPTIHCGDRSISYRDIDYLFVDPPKSIPMSGDSLERSHLSVFRSGPTTCIQILENKSRTAEATKLAIASAQAADYALPALEFSLEQLTRMQQPAEALKLAREGRAAHPDSVQHHRQYQNAMLATNQEDAVKKEYEEDYGSSLQEGERGYLKARLLPYGTSRLRDADALARGNPEHGVILVWAASVFCDVGDFARAATIYDQIKALDAPLFWREIGNVALAFIAVGRAPEMLSLLDTHFDNVDEKEQPKIAILYARVAKKVAGSDVDRLIRKIVDPGPNPTQAVTSAGHPLAAADDPSESRAYARMIAGQPFPKGSKLAIPIDAQKLWQAQSLGIDKAEAALRIDAELLPNLAADVFFLFFAESLRAAPKNLEVWRSEAQRRVDGRFIKEMERFIQSGGELDMHESELRATLFLVRSRVVALPAAERVQLLKEAQKLAVLPGAVSRAIESWSSPASASPASSPASLGDGR